MNKDNKSAEARKEAQAPKAAAKPVKEVDSPEKKTAPAPDTAGEAQPRKAVKAAFEQPRKADPLKVLAANYAEYYPECKTFHITSDRQVFLDKDKNLALLHQAGLGEGEVRTINVR